MFTKSKKKLLLSGVASFALSLSVVIDSPKAQASPYDLRISKESAVLHLASADAQGQKAQDFVENLGDSAISFLSNGSLSKTQKKSEFRKLLRNSFDMPTIGRFALGRHWRSATSEQQKEYQFLFEAMIVDVYSSRFGEYKGEKFTVSGSRADGKKDILVNSFIVPTNGSKVKVDWRVREKNGKMKIIDVIIEGVSMSLTQRSDFSSVIQRGGGKVDVLLEHLKK